MYAFLSPNICKLLPAVRALVRCDTTATLFAVGTNLSTRSATLKDMRDDFSGLQIFVSSDKDKALVCARNLDAKLYG